MRRSGLMRVVALLFALVQLALPPLATIVDARQERGSGAIAVPHAESERSASCGLAHAHCAICHFLTTPAAPPRVAAVVPVVRAASAAAADSWRSARPRALAAGARPRAPPTA